MNFESNLDLATASITEFGYSTSRPYYLSEVLFIQQMQTDIYSTNTEGSNIYNQLDTDFKQEDINQDLICPKYNFYTQFNDPITQPDSYYETSVSTPSIFLLASQPNPEINLYFRFSYIDNMIEFIISKGNINFATNNGNGIINFGIRCHTNYDCTKCLVSSYQRH
ncbi:MAG TPA: hypothetical protein VJ878_01800 [Candidatus Izemoplasmatales bacterium]|nr:hypothetical protein [Candidatus Izemoplasmatales bacterium]